MNTFNGIVLGLAVVGLFMATGCSSPPPKEDPAVWTRDALNATRVTPEDALTVGSPVEQEAIARFEKFNGDFSPENITNNTKNVYASGVYFRDPFKEIHGEPEFEAYLLRSTKAVAEYHMDWKDVAEHKGNYYFRWVMTLKLKRDGKNKPASLTTGMSHVRFSKDGKVVFHQDYYDAGAFLYEKAPIMGGVIRHIKKSL